MASQRVRCPCCDSLLQIRTPPFAQTITCPRCQQVNRFQLGDSSAENGRRASLSYRPMYGDVAPPAPASDRPTRPGPGHEKVASPAPVFHHPTPQRPLYGEEAPPTYHRPMPPQQYSEEEDAPGDSYHPAKPHHALAEGMSSSRPTIAMQPPYGESTPPANHGPKPPQSAYAEEPLHSYPQSSPAKYRPKPPRSAAYVEESPFSYPQSAYVEKPQLTYPRLVTAKPMYAVEKPTSYYRPTASPRPSYAEESLGYYRPRPSDTEETAGYYHLTTVQSPHRVEEPSYIPSMASLTLQPPSSHGRKRAVLCGVSYYGSKYQLKGSVNDVNRMRCFLTDKMGFRDDCIFTLTEDEAQPKRIPTRRNIEMALRWLVQGSQAGHSLVFYYSGHGSRVRDKHNDEIDGYNEALCPVDFEDQGKIIDDEINAMIVAPLPYGAKLHAIIDASYSGTILDLPFVCRMDRRGRFEWENQSHASSCYKGTNGGLAISITACDDDQTTEDTTALTGTPTGALTYSFIQVAQKNAGTTYGSLLNAMYSALHQARAAALSYTNGSTQDPQLSSSERFDIYSKKFIL